MTMSGGSTRKPAGSRSLGSSAGLSSLFSGELVKTSASLPTLLIYLPQHNAIKAELLLAQNADFAHPLSRQLFDLPTQSGILRIEVHPNETLDALALDAPYNWQLTLVSKIPGRGIPLTTAGQIQRVAIAPETQTQLDQASPAERVTLYQSLNLPYDACVAVDSLRRANPTDDSPQATWVTWMKTLGREDWVEIPTIG